jgi:hypothetical protein
MSLKWWVDGILQGETFLVTPLPKILARPMECDQAYIGRSNWRTNDFLNGNVYYFAVLDTALSPQEAIVKSKEVTATVTSLGNKIRFVRILAPTQGDSWLQISQLQV